MRTRVYVDGFNLYYRALRGTRNKWLDLSLLSKAMVSNQDEITRIRYFTADVSPKAGDPGAPARQQSYFRALRTLPDLTFHKGRFLPKKITRPLVSDPTKFVEVHDTEEKGSDVNLAAFLLNDAFRNEFDLALVISQDTDLIEPMRMVSQDLGKTLGIVWLDKTSPGRRHRKVASFIRHARPDILRRCQFPDPVIGRGGLNIGMPAEWK